MHTKPAVGSFPGALLEGPLCTLYSVQQIIWVGQLTNNVRDDTCTLDNNKSNRGPAAMPDSDSGVIMGYLITNCVLGHDQSINEHVLLAFSYTCSYRPYLVEVV
jgi:hypothetical protein